MILVLDVTDLHANSSYSLPGALEDDLQAVLTSEKQVIVLLNKADLLGKKVSEQPKV